MKIGKFQVLEIVKKESYKIVYLATSTDQSSYFLHEYSNSMTANHEFIISQSLLSG
ncbi:hypothetical protein KJ966_03975 [bacterium]|nr:hypothetical protein [bacterium]